ncbi:CMRF35-like molecule 2 [Carettochelys insculpta]|uniref:CMRF35-like molecule 2 n=1 Tax=Carettochelys insculpta TaxID=44489 RepID=UPI003EBC6644
MKTGPVLILILVPGCWAVTGPGAEHGLPGGLVSVHCQYGAGNEVQPKFCCRHKVVLCYSHLIFESTGSEDEEKWGKVSLCDNHTQRVITVTLENLTLAEEGTSLCGVARIGHPNPRDSVKVIVSPAVLLSIPTENAPQATDQPAFTNTTPGSYLSSPFAPTRNGSLESRDIQEQFQPHPLYSLFLVIPSLLYIICVVIWVSKQYRRNSRETVSDT